MLKGAFKKNGDGWGLMRHTPQGPVVAKGMGTFEAFYTEYQENFARYECAIHFRMATHGRTNVENAHPFEVTQGVYMMHNGMMDTPTWDVNMSDTWHLARIMQPMVEMGWLRSNSFYHLAEMAIGDYNKVVMLDKDGWIYFNKKGGVYYKGAWYSNTYAWAAPDCLLPKKKEEVKEVTSTVEDAPSRVNAEEYEAWWVSQVEQGLATSNEMVEAMIELEYNNDTDERYKEKKVEEVTSTPEDAPSRVNAEEYQAWCKTLDPFEIDENMLPQSISDWASLSTNEIRTIAYAEPDTLVEAFIELMKDTYIDGTKQLEYAGS